MAILIALAIRLASMSLPTLTDDHSSIADQCTGVSLDRMVAPPHEKRSLYDGAGELHLASGIREGSAERAASRNFGDLIISACSKARLKTDPHPPFRGCGCR